MPTTKATQRLKDTINQSKNRKITQPTQFTTPSTPVTSSVKTYNPDYPGFSEEDYRKLESDVERMGITGANKKAAMNQLYRDRIKYVRNNQLLDERAKMINEQAYHAAELDDEQADAQLRMTEFSQALKKKYNLDATANDLELFKDYIAGLGEGGADIAGQYLSGQNKKLRYDAGLKTFGEKAGEFAVGVAQSPGKRGYNMIGQLTDRIGKRAGEGLANLMSDEQKQGFIDWLDKNKLISRKNIEEYGAELQRQQAEGTTFNGREQTDIRTPILGEERADSKNVKAGEVAGDIATGIAVTAPIGAALAPTIAGSSVGGAAGIGALEGVADTAITQLGSQGDLNASAGQRALGAAGGALGGLLTKYMATLPAKQIKDIKKEATGYIEKSIKPTVKGKQSQAAYDQFIDDTLDVTDYMSKNKQILQYTDDAGEIVTGKLPKNLRETSDALSNLKKYIYDQYNSLAKKAGDNGAKVNLNKVYEKLDDLANNNAVNLANPGLKNAIESYKNQLLQYSDELGNITIQEAQDTMQYYNKILDAYFKNPGAMATDTSKNIVVANLKKGLADAVDESMDDALNSAINNGSTASQQYRDRKLLYSKIKTIEDEVSKRALVEARKNTKGLSTDIIDALAGGNLVEGLLTQNPTSLVKSIAMKGINAYNKYLNSPNTQIRNLFNLVDKVNNTSSWRTTLANNIQNIAQNAGTEGLSAPNLLGMAGGATTAAGETVGNVLSNN